MISQSTIVRDHSTSTAVDYRILAWTLFAVGIAAVAIYALAVSPPPDVDSLMVIGLAGP